MWLCVCLHMRRAEAGQSGVFTRLPLWEGGSALEHKCPACSSHSGGPICSLHVPTTSPMIQCPSSKSQPVSPWCHLPVFSRKVAKSGSRPLVVEKMPCHLPLYLQGASFGSPATVVLGEHAAPGGLCLQCSLPAWPGLDAKQPAGDCGSWPLSGEEVGSR